MKSYLLFTETKTEQKAIKKWRVIPAYDFFFLTRERCSKPEDWILKDPLPAKEPVMVADE